nr:DUF1648 domain-containing protein [uncultured Faecalicatena sp.]
MKKKWIVITVNTLVILAALTFVLPQEIPIHFGVSGAGRAINKYVILLFAPVPAFLGWAITKKYKS